MLIILFLDLGSSRSYRTSSHRSRDESKRHSERHRSSSSRRKDDKDRKRTSSSNRTSTSKNSSPSKRDSSSKTSKSKSPSKKESDGLKKEENGSDKKPIKTIEEINREKAEREQKEQQREQKEQQREERRVREREREIKLKEERQMEQDRRERERRERARKEAERVRKERERQRELEKVREREREKERERFIRERKEREEKERREKERERELFERERIERERLERERKEREKLEAERMERERQERQRLERERLEREARLEKERIRQEREARLERERVEREQLRRPMNQGLKRSANPSSDYNRYSESKRSYRDESEQTRKPFFGGVANPTDARGNLKDDLYDMAYRRNVVDSKKERDYSETREHETRRRDPRGYPLSSHKEPSDIRRVVESVPSRYPPSRERSPHRSQQQYEGRSESSRYNNTRGAEYDRRDKTWLDAPNPNAPKTLSDVLGRAGLTGILGSKAENDTRGGGDNEFSREPEQRGYGAPLRNERLERNDYSRNSESRDSPFKLDNRQTEERRVVHHPTERRDSREGYRENVRRESRPEERRFDDRRREGGDHKDPYTNDRSKDAYGGADRKEPYASSSNNNRKPESTTTSSRYESHDRRDTRRDERRDSRPDDRRDSYRLEHSKPIDRGINRQPPPSNPPRSDHRSVTERRGLHPLAAGIAARPLPTILQQAPRIVGSTADVFGRVMQQPALSAGFPLGSRPVTVQVPPSIQLRDGRLEFTRVAPPGANIQPFPRRF